LTCSRVFFLLYSMAFWFGLGCLQGAFAWKRVSRDK
jgi:hypothetical protein